MSAHVLRTKGEHLECILCDMDYESEEHAERRPCVQFGAW